MVGSARNPALAAGKDADVYLRRPGHGLRCFVISCTNFVTLCTDFFGVPIICFAIRSNFIAE
jgi:hypothetical protein